jgi:uncharacterized protein YjbJ (UPF0337 family)
LVQQIALTESLRTLDPEKKSGSSGFSRAIHNLNRARRNELFNQELRIEKIMNWEQAEGKWKQLKGLAKTKWGKLTDNDLESIAGKSDQLIGRIQERYGIAKEEAEKQVSEWNPALHAEAAEDRSRRNAS